MQMDVQALFSDAQAITTGVQLSSLAVDLQPVGLMSNGFLPQADFGQGTPTQVLVQVTTTFTGGTSLAVELVQADDVLLVTNPVTLASTGAIAEATLIAGYRFAIQYVQGAVTKRWLGLRYTTVGTHAAGKVTAGFVLTRPSVG